MEQAQMQERQQLEEDEQMEDGVDGQGIPEQPSEKQLMDQQQIQM